MNIQIYLKIVWPRVEAMLWLCEQRFVIVLVQQPLLLHATAQVSAHNHDAS